LTETKKYRTWTAQQKIEIVFARLRGDRSVREVCRDHEIAETSPTRGGRSSCKAAKPRWRGKRSAQEKSRTRTPSRLPT
jgi:transposase